MENEIFNIVLPSEQKLLLGVVNHCPILVEEVGAKHAINLLGTIFPEL